MLLLVGDTVSSFTNQPVKVTVRVSVTNKRFDPPYTLRWQFAHTREANDMLSAYPEGTRIDPVTVEFKSDDFLKLPL